VYGAWQRVGSARRSGFSSCRAMRGRRQTVPGAKMDCEEDSTQLWMEVLRQCFFGGSVMSVTYIGLTRGHSRL